MVIIRAAVTASQKSMGDLLAVVVHDISSHRDPGTLLPINRCQHPPTSPAGEASHGVVRCCSYCMPAIVRKAQTHSGKQHSAGVGVAGHVRLDTRQSRSWPPPHRNPITSTATLRVDCGETLLPPCYNNKPTSLHLTLAAGYIYCRPPRVCCPVAQLSQSFDIALVWRRSSSPRGALRVLPSHANGGQYLLDRNRSPIGPDSGREIRIRFVKRDAPLRVTPPRSVF